MTTTPKQRTMLAWRSPAIAAASLRHEPSPFAAATFTATRVPAQLARYVTPAAPSPSRWMNVSSSTEIRNASGTSSPTTSHVARRRRNSRTRRPTWA